MVRDAPSSLWLKACLQKRWPGHPFDPVLAQSSLETKGLRHLRAPEYVAKGAESRFNQI